MILNALSIGRGCWQHCTISRHEGAAGVTRDLQPNTSEERNLGRAPCACACTLYPEHGEGRGQGIQTLCGSPGPERPGQTCLGGGHLVRGDTISRSLEGAHFSLHLVRVLRQGLEDAVLLPAHPFVLSPELFRSMLPPAPAKQPPWCSQSLDGTRRRTPANMRGFVEILFGGSTLKGEDWREGIFGWEDRHAARASRPVGGARDFTAPVVPHNIESNPEDCPPCALLPRICSILKGQARLRELVCQLSPRVPCWPSTGRLHT